MKILIIDDDKEVVDFIKTSLENNSYIVDYAYTGEKGSYMARTNHYDLILIDFSLPEKNGLTVCSEIRASGSNASILFLSMNNSVRNKVDCLEKGADDYMTKPFSLDELNARIRALFRRPHKIESTVIEVGDLSIDTKKQMVRRGEKNIYLTRTEYDILEFMMKNRGMILSRGMIMEHVWSADADPFSNTIEAHIANIRKKISSNKSGGKDSSKNSDKDDKSDIIKNIAGRGYIIN